MWKIKFVIQLILGYPTIIVRIRHIKQTQKNRKSVKLSISNDVEKFIIVLSLTWETSALQNRRYIMPINRILYLIKRRAKFLWSFHEHSRDDYPIIVISYEIDVNHDSPKQLLITHLDRTKFTHLHWPLSLSPVPSERNKTSIYKAVRKRHKHNFDFYFSKIFT